MTEDAPDINIDNVQGEVVVNTDNIIHDQKVEGENEDGFHIKTMAGYVNDDKLYDGVGYSGETETEYEKNQRLGVISNSLEIKKLENEIDEKIIRKIKVDDTEERIRLKEVLALLKGYTMSSDTQNVEKERERIEKKEEKDNVNVITNKVEEDGELKTDEGEIINPDLEPRSDSKNEDIKEDVVDDKKKEENNNNDDIKSEDEKEERKDEKVKTKQEEEDPEVKKGEGEIVNLELEPKSESKNDDIKSEDQKEETKDEKVETKQEEEDGELKTDEGEIVNPDLEPRSERKNEEIKEAVVDDKKKEENNNSDDIKSKETVVSNTEKEGSEDDTKVDMKDDEKPKSEENSISQSLSKIFVNSEKTMAQIEEVKKQVCFDLEPEDIGMDDITSGNSNFVAEVAVGEIVNKLFVVEDTDKKEGKIDDDYINFPSSQANADSFFVEMSKKEERYVVQTEDISDAEAENTKGVDGNMDLQHVAENKEKTNEDGTVEVEQCSKESSEVKDEKIEVSQETEEKETKEENVEEKEKDTVNQDKEKTESKDDFEKAIRKKDEVEKNGEERDDDERSEPSNIGEDGLCLLKGN